MESYEEKIIELIESEEIAVSTITFDHEAMQIDYMDRREQAPGIAAGRSIIIMVDTDSMFEAYSQFQELAKLVIRDAIVEARDRRESIETD